MRRDPTDACGGSGAAPKQLPFPDATFDALTFTYLLRYVDDPGAAMGELARVVNPGATVASLEFHVPDAGWARAAGGSTPAA